MEGRVEAIGPADVAEDVLGDAAHPARDGERGVAGREVDQHEVENQDRRDEGGGAEEAACEDQGEPHVCAIRGTLGARPPPRRRPGPVRCARSGSGPAQRSSQTPSHGCMGPHTVSGGSMTVRRDTVT